MAGYDGLWASDPAEDLGASGQRDLLGIAAEGLPT